VAEEPLLNQLIQQTTSLRWTQKGIRAFDIKGAATRLQAQTSELGKGKARLTLLMVDAMRPLTHFEKEVVNNNIDQEEHTVVALIMWLRLLTPTDKELVQSYSLDRIRAKDIPLLSDTLSSLRALHTPTATTFQLVLILRKYSSLTGRDLGEADWEKEEASMSIHHALREANLPPGLYRKLFIKHMNAITNEMMSNVLTRKPLTAQQWWARRAVSTPSGSSSWRSVSKSHTTHLHSSSDRANKRVIHSMLPDEAYKLLLQRKPHIAARCSTKPEPGRKHRALYAACDCATIIASFASIGFEEACKFGGMVAKQAPTDVLTWLQDHNASQTAGGCWISLDYSDFNKEHRPWEQAAINYSCFKHWYMNIPSFGAAAQDKALATLWTARSYRTRVIRREGKTQAIYSGLFSGERNTARDNTLLHKIYQEITKELYQYAFGESLGIIKTHMCGDDEDTWVKNKATAISYYSVGHAVGWHFNPKKQMISTSRHEFLQYMVNGLGPVTQPLIPATVAFTTGSWYKNPVLDLKGLPDAVIRNVSALIGRGGDPTHATAMGYKYLNSLFRWQYGTHVRWDALLSATTKSTPVGSMWATTLQAQTDPPTDPMLERTQRGLPHPGVQAVINTHWQLLETLTKSQIGVVKTHLLHEAFDGWFNSQRNKVLVKPILTKGRAPYPRVTQTTTPTLRETITVGTHTAEVISAATMKKAAAITGIPLILLNMLNIPKCLANGNHALIAAAAATDEWPIPEQVTAMRNKFNFQFPF
jgi:hypothetical protein